MAPPVQWKRNPPCLARTILKEMFENKKIQSDDPPAKIYDLHDEFKKFNTNVFRNVFNELRAMYGVGCKFSYTTKTLVFIKYCFKLLVRNRSVEVGAASGFRESGSKRMLDEDTPENSEENPDSKLSYHQNEPFLMTVYRDETQKEKLSLLVALPGGCDDVEFSLVGGGGGSSTARITYCWPKSLYNIDHIFGKSCQAPFHPKIMGFKKELENNRETVDAIPRSILELKLPIPVQTAIDSYTFSGGVKDDGTRLLMADLTAYQNNYTHKQADKKVKFLAIKDEFE